MGARMRRGKEGDVGGDVGGGAGIVVIHLRIMIEWEQVGVEKKGRVRTKKSGGIQSSKKRTRKC